MAKFVDQARIDEERKRGIWPDRVITDYVDGWLAEKPDAAAVIAFRAGDGSTALSLAATHAIARALRRRSGTGAADRPAQRPRLA